ncbi:hypothetical protein [Kaistia adipata]|uniref:hypothetical protein n=1 Tax=Kaistia adipata TaxID=166954 RepID=UPI000405CCED|nr:hypothetical protein [Kaistia adipata]
MSSRAKTPRPSAAALREEALRSQYKALNRWLAAAVLHARPTPQSQMTMSTTSSRDAEME